MSKCGFCYLFPLKKIARGTDNQNEGATLELVVLICM
jgi:hypothetical protein